MNKQEIYINGRFLVRPISGVERFSIEICKHLLQLNPEIKIGAPFKAKNQTSINSESVIFVGNYSGHYWEQVTLPLFLKQKDNPILLNLANLAPIFYSNKIVTLHDIAFKEHPEWFSYFFAKYYNSIVPLILKKSLHIFTVSKFSKSSICEAYGIAENKISVVYNGLSQSFLNQDSVERLYNFPYVLSVGTFQPRKNLLRLIEAYNGIESPEFKLVIVGASNKVFKAVDNGSLSVCFPYLIGNQIPIVFLITMTVSKDNVA